MPAAAVEEPLEMIVEALVVPAAAAEMIATECARNGEVHNCGLHRPNGDGEKDTSDDQLRQPSPGDRDGVSPPDHDNRDRPCDQKRQKNCRPDFHVSVAEGSGHQVSVQLQSKDEGDDDLMRECERNRHRCPTGCGKAEYSWRIWPSAKKSSGADRQQYGKAKVLRLAFEDVRYSAARTYVSEAAHSGSMRSGATDWKNRTVLRAPPVWFASKWPFGRDTPWL